MKDFVAGRIAVRECLRAGKRKAHRLFLLRGAKGLDALREAARGLPVAERSRAELDALVGGATHQGVLLEAAPVPIHRAEDWLTHMAARPEFPGDAVVVVLDGVEDPHNFGAIIRSAAACGANAVIFGKDRAAPISPAAVKSAAGGVEYVDLVCAVNLVRCLDGLKEVGFWTAGLDAEAPQLLWDADLTGRVALVVGSEGKGLRRLVRQACDLLLRIPLTGPITSLNASVSAAAALVECARQRAERSARSERG